MICSTGKRSLLFGLVFPMAGCLIGYSRTPDPSALVSAPEGVLYFLVTADSEQSIVSNVAAASPLTDGDWFVHFKSHDDFTGATSGIPFDVGAEESLLVFGVKLDKILVADAAGPYVPNSRIPILADADGPPFQPDEYCVGKVLHILPERCPIVGLDPVWGRHFFTLQDDSWVETSTAPPVFNLIGVRRADE